MLPKKLTLINFCLLFFFVLIEANPIHSAILEVGKHKILELTFTAKTSPDNPFDTYLLKLKITDPDGKNFVIDGFFDGDGNGGQEGKIWKARICPYAPGEWSWQTVKGDQYDNNLDGLHGSFLCVESGDIGGVIAENKFFRFQDGDFTYLQGTFLDFAHGLRTTHSFMSETTSDAQRDQIMERHANFHRANKFNIYLSNKGDYESQSVTPWRGNASNNDKSRMDLPRWRDYDNYFHRIKDVSMLAEVWFFADDSNFGKLSQAIKNRLFRYAMARTSAFSNTLYVIALEWEEGWSKSSVAESGNYIQAHNPWGRLLSVHSIPPKPSWWEKKLFSIPMHKYWAFSGERWATFIATQAGNTSQSREVNQLAINMRLEEEIPHVSEEFGHLNSDSDAQMRKKMWANFCGGAAGGGTGSDLKAFMLFLQQNRVPFQRMQAANSLVQGGGDTRYCLAEEGHHYVIYSQSGPFSLKVNGSSLKGQWFNPQDPDIKPSTTFDISPGTHTFTPPDETIDWVLWITDGSHLNGGVIHPSAGSHLMQEIISKQKTY